MRIEQLTGEMAEDIHDDKHQNNNNNSIYKAHRSHHKKETVQGVQLQTTMYLQ